VADGGLLRGADRHFASTPGTGGFDGTQWPIVGGDRFKQVQHTLGTVSRPRCKQAVACHIQRPASMHCNETSVTQDNL